MKKQHNRSGSIFLQRGRPQMMMRMADDNEHPFEAYTVKSYAMSDWCTPSVTMYYKLEAKERQTTISFEELDCGVRVTHRILHRSREARDGHLQAGMEAGSVQTLRRLDEYAAQMGENSTTA